MNKICLIVLAVILIAGCNNKEEKNKNTSVIGCQPSITSDKEWYNSNKKAPLFNGLDGINFKISTTSEEAQKYFNQGMMLAYGFNHAEAARSFYEATRLDSNCAMAWWGFAYVLGPNYNAGMEPDNYTRAYNAMMKAASLTKNCTSLEKEMIQAIQARYIKTAPSDRSSLDIAYAAAMKKVYEQFPSNPDVGALYAESLMNLHPWDLYDKQSKLPKEWTHELVAVLEHLMKINPMHPGAHHFYIHALEASATPEKALKSASLLDTLVNGAGHLLHMPSHIYINTGHYHKGTIANLRAIAVDSIYTIACNAQGVYPLAYYPHNYHFLTATAALEGNSNLSWNAALKLQAHTAKDLMQEPEWGTLQHYYSIPYYIAVKFGMWDTILSIPQPTKNLIYPTAIWHYAKGMAYLGKNDIVNAKKELSAIKVLATDTLLNQITIWGINTTTDLVQIASKVLEAEIAARQYQFTSSIALLYEAIAIEDKLNYNEPPDWFFSVRHHLGAVLLKAGKYSDAENVYQKDLQTWKNNGWALMGLYQSLIFQKKEKEALQVKAAFDEAWQYADIKISSSSVIAN
ncbi:MAG: hypothetical protein KF741_11620 [Ferruginibacter sp.]|nr:hypothetical protein [Bacteroidota bacterium]MBX2919883.1 hypothetical protein [Ferruginibacter sp.]